MFGGQKPGFLGLMQQQAQYNNSRQASMTPAEKRRHELFSMMANSGQQPASFSPVQFGGPGNGGTLSDFVTAILKQGKGGV
ncbi:hypothetical protein ACSBOB_00910 [Mesorhizobium sp. ASY16-5R]|uniref:hypothetical protein n=1 Tax=Mesorhizobium sp. ASY16-5R TaxID=3445772 RepID=UPI003F9F1736